ncbi:cytochrome c oxidase assembly factor CtaG [Evansella tamaricis]|uniref:Cytochrome c oxidase assembly factor CtaG n=1 Tax=Evansella tamaricis TaxID=2069301 RepID=A0ABS6JGN9_9BACI|nr:cytochrome c oxidase assembly factor CtaG [Evansella tamaricis]MBU9711488.1 cytochrome c oxidase assembly factor CtaG [Evansella tamaricis]
MELFFSSFSARTIWTPELFIVLTLISMLYFWVIGPLRHKFPDAKPVPMRRKIYFHLGLLAVYFGFGGPLYVLGHLMLSMHMLSMAIVYLIAPPLLLIGIPSWFFIYFKQFKILRGIFLIVGFPIVGLVLFNAMISFYHLPNTFDMLLTNEGWHNIYQIGMLIAALLMWWHLLPRMITKYNMSELKKVGYMLASGALFTPACVLIIFAGEPLYATYTDPAIWALAISYCLPAGANIPYEIFTTGSQSIAPLSPLNDQQLGGASMKVIQELVYAVAMGYVFKQWMNRDKETNATTVYKEYEMEMVRPNDMVNLKEG